MTKLQNKVVLITGGGKGIGRETALLFAKSGSRIVITGREEQPLLETCERMRAIGGQCLPLTGDVTEDGSCERIIKQVIQTYGQLDVLINNAGKSMRGSFLKTSLKTFTEIIDVNFLGAVKMSQMALPHLMKTKGSLVFISSVSGLKGLPFIAPYSAAKMALTSFSESLRSELHSHHVHVGIIYVGFTENDQGKTILDGQGNLQPLMRKKNHHTQVQVAQHIVRSVKHRKAVMVLTPLGKLAAWFYRWFPRLSSILLQRFANKSKWY